MSLCPNLYDENNSACQWCNFRIECELDSAAYLVKYSEDFPQIALDV